jgi:hypothetical protein
MRVRIRPETLVIVAFAVVIIAAAVALIGLRGIGTLFVAAGLGCCFWLVASLVIPEFIWPSRGDPLTWPRWMPAVTAVGLALIVIGYVLIQLGGGFEQPEIEIPRQ